MEQPNINAVNLNAMIEIIIDKLMELARELHDNQGDYANAMMSVYGWSHRLDEMIRAAKGLPEPEPEPAEF